MVVCPVASQRYSVRVSASGVGSGGVSVGLVNCLGGGGARVGVIEYICKSEDVIVGLGATVSYHGYGFPVGVGVECGASASGAIQNRKVSCGGLVPVGRHRSGGSQCGAAECRCVTVRPSRGQGNSVRV